MADTVDRAVRSGCIDIHLVAYQFDLIGVFVIGNVGIIRCGDKHRAVGDGERINRHDASLGGKAVVFNHSTKLDVGLCLLTFLRGVSCVCLRLFRALAFPGRIARICRSICIFLRGSLCFLI